MSNPNSEFKKRFKVRSNNKFAKYWTVKECITDNVYIVSLKTLPNDTYCAKVVNTKSEEIDIHALFSMHDIAPKFVNKYSLNRQVNCLIMEHCVNDLFTLFKKEDDIKDSWLDKMINITKKVQLMHSFGYCHRDLKLENILLTKDGDLKIADFEFTVKRKVMTAVKGSPGYAAPEIVRSEPYGIKCDVWSLGVIMYILTENRFPNLEYLTCSSQRICKFLSDKVFIPEKDRCDSTEFLDFLTSLKPTDAN